MSRYRFGFYTKDARFIERTVDAVDLESAEALALVLAAIRRQGIRFSMCDMGAEHDPKIEALFELARRSLHGEATSCARAKD